MTAKQKFKEMDREIRRLKAAMQFYKACGFKLLYVLEQNGLIK